MATEKCVCDHCESRYTWDCDDGRAYPRGGCSNFVLDYSTLSRKQQLAIQRILSNNDYDRPRTRFAWEDE